MGSNSITAENAIDTFGLSWELSKLMDIIFKDFVQNRVTQQILVEGPQGSGKTTVVKLGANKTQLPFIYIPASISSQLNEADAALHLYFEQAREQAPSVIFLDDVDLLAPKSATTVKDFRIISAIEDELAQSREYSCPPVLLIASATNIANIHPSISQCHWPWNVERIRPFSDASRHQIFRQWVRRVGSSENASSDEIDSLVNRTPGYVAVDMVKLYAEAKRITYRQQRYKPTFTSCISEGIGKVRPQLLGPDNGRWEFMPRRDIFSRPLFGLNSALQDMEQCLQSVFCVKAVSKGERSSRKALSALGHFRGLLLHGASGTGKSALLTRAPSLLPAGSVNVMWVDSTDIISSVIGEGERRIVQIFAAARAAAPTLLLIENLQILAPKRSFMDESNDGNSSRRAFDRLLSTFLVELDGITPNDNAEQQVFLIATSSNPGEIDPAMLRPGRFELHVEIKPPSAFSRRQIWHHAFSIMLQPPVRDLVMSNVELVTDLCSVSENKTAGEIYAIVREIVLSLLHKLPMDAVNVPWQDASIGQEVVSSLQRVAQSSMAANRQTHGVQLVPTRRV